MFMHVKAETMAFSGLLLALTVIFMVLGSVIETSTLFLLAAASFFVGIIIREFGLRIGAAFYAAGVILGFITAPNKFYVFTFAAMGLYIWGREAAWRWIVRHVREEKSRTAFLLFKYGIFNLVYIPIVVIFREMLFAKAVSTPIFVGVMIAGQIGILIYDKAYDYVQVHLWGKMRARVMS